MTERIFAQHRLPKQVILNYIYKIYNGVLNAMSDGDTEFLNEYCEAHFSKRIQESLKQLKDKGITIKLHNDVTGEGGVPVGVKTEFLDAIMVKGLSWDRDLNGSQKDYHKWTDIEEMGLFVFTPHTLTNPENFIDPETNKKIYEGSDKVVLRAFVKIRSPLRFKVLDPLNALDKSFEHDFTWDHVALFETQMKPPPKFRNENKLENFMEWLGKFKFGAWKMADLDDFMLGNPLVVKDNVRDKYMDEIFKGSKYDPKQGFSIRWVQFDRCNTSIMWPFIYVSLYLPNMVICVYFYFIESDSRTLHHHPPPQSMFLYQRAHIQAEPACA
eukprot:TRINITY_DN8453_c0_g1_i5.p1 TRINITY_DN8453_c0_g1~~TRINITY_DN8453_c0_g1_i5.p1  ORF type:complete len:327 (-),score=54.60 TRINITY_DN8453_c0_g1_i5:287-1267(-)